MVRWEPDARGRLLGAAVELFTEQGYGATTVTQIAERAGLTKTTLFRQFADKREIIFQGQDALIALAVDAIDSAPGSSDPFEILEAAVLALCTMHPADLKAFQGHIDGIVSSSAELRERANSKRFAITKAVHEALSVRLGDASQAGILADLGLRAYYDGFESWIASPGHAPLDETVRRELVSSRAALRHIAALGG